MKNKNIEYRAVEVNSSPINKTLPRSVFDFWDNSEELIAKGIGWDHPDFTSLYKIRLQLSQPLELHPKD